MKIIIKYVKICNLQKKKINKSNIGQFYKEFIEQELISNIDTYQFKKWHSYFCYHLSIFVFNFCLVSVNSLKYLANLGHFQMRITGRTAEIVFVHRYK